MNLILTWIWNNTRIISVILLIALTVLGVKYYSATSELNDTKAKLEKVEKEFSTVKAGIDKLKLDYEYSVQTLENENKLLSQKHESELREIELRWENKIPDNSKCEDAAEVLKREAIRMRAGK